MNEDGIQQFCECDDDNCSRSIEICVSECCERLRKKWILVLDGCSLVTNRELVEQHNGYGYYRVLGD